MSFLLQWYKHEYGQTVFLYNQEDCACLLTTVSECIVLLLARHVNSVSDSLYTFSTELARITYVIACQVLDIRFLLVQLRYSYVSRSALSYSGVTFLLNYFRTLHESTSNSSNLLGGAYEYCKRSTERSTFIF